MIRARLERIFPVVVVIVPFIAWHVYIAVRALRRGVYESLTGPVDRRAKPAVFWFLVVHQLMVSVAFVGALAAVVFEPSASTVMKLVIGYFVVYVAIVIATALRARPRSGAPLEPTGPAGRSARDR